MIPSVWNIGEATIHRVWWSKGRLAIDLASHHETRSCALADPAAPSFRATSYPKVTERSVG